jgi:hypothetical protein
MLLLLYLSFSPILSGCGGGGGGSDGPPAAASTVIQGNIADQAAALPPRKQTLLAKLADMLSPVSIAHAGFPELRVSVGAASTLTVDGFFRLDVEMSEEQADVPVLFESDAGAAAMDVAIERGTITTLENVTFNADTGRATAAAITTERPDASNDGRGDDSGLRHRTRRRRTVHRLQPISRPPTLTRAGAKKTMIPTMMTPTATSLATKTMMVMSTAAEMQTTIRTIMSTTARIQAPGPVEAGSMTEGAWRSRIGRTSRKATVITAVVTPVMVITKGAAAILRRTPVMMG